MKLILTFKLEPESKEDAIGMAGFYDRYRTGIEAACRDGRFGPADKVELRWLLATKKYQ